MSLIDPLPQPPPVRTRVRTKPRTSGIESRCNYLLTQVVKDRSQSERPFQAIPPAEALANSDRYLCRISLQVLFRTRVASPSEENVSGVACPCQPVPRFFFSSRFRRVFQRFRDFAGTPGHSLACFGDPSWVAGAWCGEEGTRTPDLLLAKQALYQLSYFPFSQSTRAACSPPMRMLVCVAASLCGRVRVPGFEPGTSALSELRSSQLSYTREPVRKTRGPNR